MTGNVVPFNPLEKRNLGASVAEAMLARQAAPLHRLPRFSGAGIYALYYTGTLDFYKSLSEANREGRFSLPIYIGKAVPEGARKGGGSLDQVETQVLWKRLKEHADSVHRAENLDVGDVFCRFLVVDDIWIPLAESLLITKFGPVWNSIIDGFGNHDPGGGRYQGMRPRWDVLHPGRSWALKCQDRPETAADITRDVEEFLRARLPPSSQIVVKPNEGQPSVPT